MREVIAVRRPERQCIDLFIKLGPASESGEGGALVEPGSAWFATPDQGPPLLIAPMQEPPLYMRIPDQDAQAIADALHQRPVATERHLDDAIKVRDALLMMVSTVVGTSARAAVPPSPGPTPDRVTVAP